MTKLLVLGIDAATWKIIKPNLDSLPNFKKVIKEGESKTLIAKDTLLSPALWCTIFSGKTLSEHGHEKFVVNGNLQKREDIKVNFIWDELDKNYNVKVLQVPFIMPPFNFNIGYEPIGYGASSDLNELASDMDNLLFKSLETIKQSLDLFIVVFGMLDKLEHFHWGEDKLILSWYQKMDNILGILSKYAQKIIVVSDHGFCSRGEAKIKTLPDKNDKGEPLKGDHQEEAILITKNVSYPINEQKDIYEAIKYEMNG